ncbi:MAG: cbb3-type cytochrome c oxidase subunit 3 [Myxococcota bacterium]
MRLSDIMGNMNLAIWPSIGLILFLAIFAVVVALVFSRKRAKLYEDAGRIPLEDDVVIPRETSHD